MQGTRQVEYIKIKEDDGFSSPIYLGKVLDITVNRNSILDSNGEANIPIASSFQSGVVQVHADHGLKMDNNFIEINPASSNEIRIGTNTLKPITPFTQKDAAFYGLAKAAGDVTQSSSSNAVGTYTTSAKTAIRNMLDTPSKAESFASFPATYGDEGKVLTPTQIDNSKVTEWSFINQVLVVHRRKAGLWELDRPWQSIYEANQTGISVCYLDNIPFLLSARQEDDKYIVDLIGAKIYYVGNSVSDFPTERTRDDES